MNSDPFNLRRASPFAIIQGQASRAATNLAQRAIDTGAEIVEQGRQTVEDMSGFAQPNHIPSFVDPDREKSSLGAPWTGSTAARSRGIDYRYGNGMMEGVQDRMGQFFEKNQDLPMYKDKPYATSRRSIPIWKRRKFFAAVGLVFMFILYMTGWLKSEESAGTVGRDADDILSWLRGSEKGVDWNSRREKVVDAFTLSWDAYKRYAWGYDEFHPVSKTGKQMTPKGMGWIIVDALDTLMLMNQTTRLHDARQWLAKLDYDQDQEVNTFETTIRMLGGLLSAHYLSTTFPDMCPLTEDDPGTAGEDLYLEKAKDLGDRIMGAFESPSGVPFASVNLKTMQGVQSHDDAGASSTAEATTLQLEFKYLAKLTGETYFWEKAEKVMEVVDNNGAEAGLVPIYVYATSGVFRGRNIRLGSRGDSYYEYLIKQYLQTNKKEKVYENMWDEALAGVRKHLITYSKDYKFTVLGERPNGLEEALSPKMDHLVCFMPGTIALAATGGIPLKEARKAKDWTKKKEEELKLARELTYTCWGMYKAMATGLAGEITHFHIDNPPLKEGAPHNPPATLDGDEWKSDFDVKAQDKHNLQRPETVESLFYMWRITGDEIYREWGWEMFKSFMEYSAVEHGGGFTSLSNADTIPPVTRDNMESFWLAETLKYFYLLFSPNDLLPLDDIVINTEAHAFPRFDMGSMFKTGWQRKPRDAEGKIIKEPEPVKESHEHVEIKTVAVDGH